MRKTLIVLIVLWGSINLLYSCNAKEENGVKENVQNVKPDTAIKDNTSNSKKIDAKINEPSKTSQSVDTSKTKTVSSFTGYKIKVPATMTKLGKEIQAMGLDGKARNAEMRLKDTISGAMLIVRNLYPPYGERIFNKKMAERSPQKINGYEVISDTSVFRTNGKGQKLENPIKIVDVLIKANNNKIYELRLKSNMKDFDNDSKWFNNTLNNFLKH